MGSCDQVNPVSEILTDRFAVLICDPGNSGCSVAVLLPGRGKTVLLDNQCLSADLDGFTVEETGNSGAETCLTLIENNPAP